MKHEPASLGDLSLGQQLRHRLAFWWSRMRGQDYPLTVTLFGQPVTLVISTSREFRRAAAVSYEGMFLQRVLAHLQRGDTFFDVGANIGLVSVIVGRQPVLVDGGTLHAFEPEPRNLAHLERNLAANGLLTMAWAHGVALAREEGTAALHVRGEAGEGRHSLVAAQGATGTIEVTVATMDGFCARAGVEPDVVKIDVEGAEGEVLAGMNRLLERGRPRELFMEIHNKGGEDRMPSGVSIDAWLGGFGYTCVWEERRGHGRHRHYRKTAAA